jgi:hypothetical protein
MRLSGLSRTVTYELLAEGKIQAVKLNSKTLIDVQSGLGFMRSLPPAKITTGRRRASRAVAAAEIAG